MEGTVAVAPAGPEKRDAIPGDDDGAAAAPAPAPVAAEVLDVDDPDPDVPEADPLVAADPAEILGVRDQFGFPTLLAEDFVLKVAVHAREVVHTLVLTRDAFDDISSLYKLLSDYLEACAVTRDEFFEWCSVEGDALAAAEARLAELDPLRAEIAAANEEAKQHVAELAAREAAEQADAEGKSGMGAAKVVPLAEEQFSSVRVGCDAGTCAARAAGWWPAGKLAGKSAGLAMRLTTQPAET